MKLIMILHVKRLSVVRTSQDGWEVWPPVTIRRDKIDDTSSMAGA